MVSKKSQPFMPKAVGTTLIGIAGLVVMFGAIFFAPDNQPDLLSSTRLLPVVTSAPVARPSVPTNSSMTIVNMEEKDGTLTVPTTINGSLKLNFILDSGASDVQIPADVLMTMIRSGTLDKSDLMGRRSYRLANGLIVTNCIIKIKNLAIGAISVNDVVGSTAAKEGELLLGQSFLSRISSWSIDNNNRVLVLGSVKPEADTATAIPGAPQDYTSRGGPQSDNDNCQIEQD